MSARSVSIFDASAPSAVASQARWMCERSCERVGAIDQLGHRQLGRARPRASRCAFRSRGSSAARRKPSIPDRTSLWLYETSNALVAAVRRRRLPEAAIPEVHDLLDALDVEIDGRADRVLGRAIQALALATGLSAYDAAYLELVERRAPAWLATLDDKLARAAASRGIRGLPTRR